LKKKRFLKCDFRKCEEMAQWYRVWKGELLKLCTKHEAYMARRHLGKALDSSELDGEDWAYLEEKDEPIELS